VDCDAYGGIMPPDCRQIPTLDKILGLYATAILKLDPRIYAASRDGSECAR